MSALDDWAAYRVTRPVRALVLVPLPDGLPWQAAMMAALRGQAATWGGAANLPVPWTDDLTSREEFWAIATALDPDVIAVARFQPSDFTGLFAGDVDELAGQRDALNDDRDMRRDVRRVSTLLSERLPVLQNRRTTKLLRSTGRGIGFPGTPIDALAGGPSRGSALRCADDLDLGLMLAAELGDLADVMVDDLARQNVAVDVADIAPAEALQLVLGGQRDSGGSGIWPLSEAGLVWLTPLTGDLPTVSVVVGDDPWDFALGYALRRMSSLCWWLPTSMAADPATAYRLRHRISDIAEPAEHGVVYSRSAHHAETLVEALTEASHNGIKWSVGQDAAEMVPAQASRLLSDVPGLETLAVQGGTTGFLPPQLPAVGEAQGKRIYWMSEILGDSWQPVADARLSSAVVRMPGYDSAHARTTRSGVAYLCPHFLRMSADMESEVVRPRIAPLTLSEQLAIIASESKSRLEPSDKGLYADGAAKLMGGAAALQEALCDPAWWRTLTALHSAYTPEDDQRGWRLGDRRIYYSIAELEDLLSETGLEHDVGELVSRKVLLRGLVYRCALCRMKAWYGADELADRLRCARCRESFALADGGWQPAREPQWRYRLNEMIWQLLQHNGDVPLRALRDALGFGKKGTRVPTSALYEHDLWTSGAARPIELDICAQLGPDLWIGEAKTGRNFGKKAASETKLAGLRQATEILRPHGVLFVTSHAEGWSQHAQQAARRSLRGVPSRVRFVTCPRPGSTKTS